MRGLDWAVVAAYLLWVVWDGLARSRRRDDVEGYLLASRSLPWWVAGLTVMATQLSAITLVGGIGQGFDDGLRFVQFYLGLPLAMVILCLTAVPWYHRVRATTAYEVLERRFDGRTRTLTSILFLLSRGLACGTVLAAPAVILSIVLQLDFHLTVLVLGLTTLSYTALGGVAAVAWTDVKQVAVIVLGVAAVVVVLVAAIPEPVGLGGALRLAGTTGRMRSLDLRFDLTETYTVWSGLIGGLFLMLSYFGCDQSQVQRFLTARSADEGRHALLLSAYVKIPLQALILLTGVLVFAFYLFQAPPLLFHPAAEARLRSGPRADEYRALERDFAAAHAARAAAAAAGLDGDGGARFAAAEGRVKAVRTEALALARAATGDPRLSDVNYVFPTFVLTRLPPGLAGLLVAAILAAAMSTIAAELNALATSSVVDLWARLRLRGRTGRVTVGAARWATVAWGLFACAVATQAVNLGSLIVAVNRFGSIFYGSILGVFILAFGVRRASPAGAFWGLLAGMAVVLAVALGLPRVAFLWHNLIGAAVVVAVGAGVRPRPRLDPEA